jgi:hypothetical protein
VISSVIHLWSEKDIFDDFNFQKYIEGWWSGSSGRAPA